MVEIKVDCNVPEITITWHAIVDDSFSDADVVSIKNLLDVFWKDFKYGNCPVKFVFDLKRAGDVNASNKKEYDEVHPKGAGGGDTVGPSEPEAQHKLYLSGPSDVIHEFGHCVGIRDHLVDDGTGKKHWKHWDENMLTASNGLVDWVIYHARGKEIEAKCCKRKNGYHMDHEVGVIITVEKATKPEELFVNVTAVSLAHEIAKFRVWGKDGKQVGDDISKLQRKQDPGIPDPKGDTMDPNLTNQVDWPHEGKKDFINVPKNVFPICIGVLEKAGPNEAADWHVHGWFGEDGKPREGADHFLEKGRPKGYYPALAGGADGPGAYKPAP